MKISSVGKKVAIGAGAAAAVGLTALAYVKGKKNLAETDAFVNSNAVKKAGMAVGNGFKTMGQAALAKIKTIPGKVKEIATNIADKVKGLFHKAPQAEDTAAVVAEKLQA